MARLSRGRRHSRLVPFIVVEVRSLESPGSKARSTGCAIFALDPEAPRQRLDERRANPTSARLGRVDWHVHTPWASIEAFIDPRGCGPAGSSFSAA